jgi:hypothetical protein
MQTLTKTIPSIDQLDSTADRLALALSVLDEIETVLEHSRADQTMQLPTSLKGNRDAVARLVAFTCDVEGLAGSMIATCGRIKPVSLALYSELRDAA